MRWSIEFVLLAGDVRLEFRQHGLAHVESFLLPRVMLHPETDLPEAKQLRLCLLSKSGLRY